MRIFLSAIACFLLSFVTGNSFPSEGRSIMIVAAPPVVGQCPPCLGSCVANGIDWSGITLPESCGTTCEGTADVLNPINNGAGRHELKTIQVNCVGSEGSCGSAQSYEIVQNVCCPVGQEDPHLECDSGQGGSGKCQFVSGCGASNCTTAGQDCGCDQGLNKPHYECNGVFCEEVDSCGVDECDPSIEPTFCDSGCTWSCAEARCVGVGCESPVIVDISGNGFNLTDGSNGVDFDIDGNGTKERIAWTSLNTDDAFLALDLNGNGTIDSGKELFGNFTPQPRSRKRNGFIALAEFDKPQNDGNGDGRISIGDAVFLSLRMWVDRNHNGVSEANELYTLPSVGLMSIDLDYRESRRRDRHGNLFLYRVKVRDARGAQLGRWAYDVFLVAP